MPALETQTVVIDAVQHYAKLAELPVPTVYFDLKGAMYSDIDNTDCSINFNMSVYDEQEFIEDIIPAAVANMSKQFEKARAVFRSNVFNPIIDDVEPVAVKPRKARKPAVVIINNRDGSTPKGITNVEQAVEIYLQNTGSTRQEMITYIVDGMGIEGEKARHKAASLYQTAKKKVEA